METEAPLEKTSDSYFCKSETIICVSILAYGYQCWVMEDMKHHNDYMNVGIQNIDYIARAVPWWYAVAVLYINLMESVDQWLEISLVVHEVQGSNPDWKIKLAVIFTLG